jgi:ABC-type xylose transport system permease subunit
MNKYREELDCFALVLIYAIVIGLIVTVFVTVANMIGIHWASFFLGAVIWIPLFIVFMAGYLLFWGLNNAWGL